MILPDEKHHVYVDIRVEGDGEEQREEVEETAEVENAWWGWEGPRLPMLTMFAKSRMVQKIRVKRGHSEGKNEGRSC